MDYNKRIADLVRINHPDPAFCVKKLADMLDVSNAYLWELTVRVHGLTPCELIELYRIRTAMTIMSIEDTDMIRVSLKSGFGSIRAFRDAFQRRLNMTPSECRDTIKDRKQPDPVRKLNARLNMEK